MIGSLITSQTRIKLLKKFFLNSSTQAHLRGLESEFGESTNSIRIELNRLEKAGLLHSMREGNRKYYKANSGHPLYNDIHNIILKETGIDMVIEKVIHRIGDLWAIYLTGDFAKGKDSKVIELIIIGNGIDTEYLSKKIVQVENIIGREVKYILLNPVKARETISLYKPSDLFLLWSENNKKVNE